MTSRYVYVKYILDKPFTWDDLAVCTNKEDIYVQECIPYIIIYLTILFDIFLFAFTFCITCFI